MIETFDNNNYNNSNNSNNEENNLILGTNNEVQDWQENSKTQEYSGNQASPVAPPPQPNSGAYNTEFEIFNTNDFENQYKNSLAYKLENPDEFEEEEDISNLGFNNDIFEEEEEDINIEENLNIEEASNTEKDLNKEQDLTNDKDLNSENKNNKCKVNIPKSIQSLKLDPLITNPFEKYYPVEQNNKVETFRLKKNNKNFNLLIKSILFAIIFYFLANTQYNSYLSSLLKLNLENTLYINMVIFVILNYSINIFL